MATKILTRRAYLRGARKLERLLQQIPPEDLRRFSEKIRRACQRARAAGRLAPTGQ